MAGTVKRDDLGQDFRAAAERRARTFRKLPEIFLRSIGGYTTAY